MRFSGPRLLATLAIFVAGSTLAFGSDYATAPSFSVPAAELLASANASKPAKGDSVTILLDEHEYHIDAKGRVTERAHLIYQVHTDNAVRGWANAGSAWEPWHQEQPHVRARVITADGGQHDLDPKTLTDAANSREETDVFEDTRTFSGPLPSLAAGAVVEEEETVVDKEPFFERGANDRIAFARTVTALHSRVTIEAADSLSLKYALHNLPEAKVEKTSASGITRLEIELGQLPRMKNAFSYVAGNDILFREVEFSIADSWNDLARRFDAMIEPQISTADTPKLAVSGTREAKIQQVLEAMHDRVRYTGIEFGQNRIVPHSTKTVLSREYGDCKDKAALLVAMLRAAGIPANLALLRTGYGQDVSEDIPGMGLFDHAIVYVPGSPGIWIDATARYFRSNELPFADQDRLALIVAPETTKLMRTPLLGAAANSHREQREVMLPDIGEGKIIETTHPEGAEEANLRAQFSDDTKSRSTILNYVKQTYLAKESKEFHHTSATDFRKPFELVLTAEKSKRAVTSTTTASVVINPWDLLGDVPNSLRRKPAPKSQKDDDADEQDEDAAEAAPERKVDWFIEPFETKWEYVIHMPEGFVPRSLPATDTLHFGPAEYSQEFKLDGAVIRGTLKLTLPRARFTVAEASAMQEGIESFGKRNMIVVGFDHKGESLFHAGKVREGLDVYRSIAAAHPKDALQQIRLAQGLLDAGLGESARKVARQAVTLEPKNPRAWAELAWVLQHDLIGRQYEVGSDYDGAIEAYKKVLDLDSKDVTSRVNYAVLLEYGPDGVHYASTHLDEAVKQIRAVKEQDAELGARYDLNVIVDLFFAGQFQKMLDAASALGDSEAIRQYRIAATSVLSSSDQAIQMANSSSSDEATRVRLLAGAGQFLLRTRHYKKAVALLEAASGNATASALAQQMQVLRNARPLEENTIPETDPRSPAQRILRMMTGGVDSSDRTLDAILSKQFWRTTRHENMKRAIEVSKGMLQSEMKRGETSRQVFADLVDSSIRYTVDGDEQSGFRVRATPIMGEPIDLIVIREDAQYKVLAMKPDYAPVGLEALERLSHSDVEGARKMLEWVRANVSVTNGEDPLAGQTFPRIWSRGDQGDAAHIELAAAALVADQSDRFDQVARLEKVLASATDRYEEAASLSLAHLYLRTKQWDKALPLLKPLAERYPESNSVFLSEFRAMRHLGRAPEAVALAQQRLKRAPDDDTLVENLADAYAAAGQFDKASDTLKVIAESGHATSNLLNSYAWMATFLPVPPQPAVEAAERANAMTNSENFAILHTLACLYAAGGKPLEARDLLLKAMTAAHMSQPDREVWFGFARIAEQYGDYETAAAEYARVTSTDVDNEGPTSTFTLAQKQIGALKSAGKVTDKATANGN